MRITPEIESALHRRLQDGDPTAPADLAQLFLEPLFKTIKGKWPGVDAAFVKDAITDAVLGYIENPASFKAEKARLFSYLVLASIANLKTRLGKETRLSLREVSLDVEHSGESENYIVEVPDPNGLGEQRLVDIVYGKRVAKQLFSEIVDPTDRKLIGLVVDGVRETAEYAEVMRIGHLSTAEQKKAVKQAKDRLLKQLQRFGLRTHGRPN